MFNKLKQENEQLKSQILTLQNNSSIYLSNYNFLKSTYDQLKSDYAKLQEEYNKIDLDSYKKELKVVQNEYNQKVSEISTLQNQINSISSDIQIQTYGIFDLPEDIKYYKSELNNIRKDQKHMILSEKYYTCKSWSINGNASEGDRLLKFLVKTSITSFNLYSDSMMEKINLSNKSTILSKLKTTYNMLNNNLNKFDINLSSEYFNLKLSEAEMMVNVSVKVQQDKDEAKRQKEIIREQELAERELDKEKDRLERELLKLENQQLKGDDSPVLNDSIKKIKDELNINEYRRENTLSGYVYFIVNKSFNNDCYIKVGCTRRPEAQIRIDELNCASVPFKFFALGTVFTDEAFKLEHEIHQRLDQYRVNKANIRKEFFQINPHQLEKILNDEFNLDVHFDYELDDLEWKSSQNNS